MASFRALYDEFCLLQMVFDDDERDLDEVERERIWRRISSVFAMINTSSPASVADCAVKIRLLLDPALGMAAGVRPEDFVSLSQVAEFLEGLRADEGAPCGRLISETGSSRPTGRQQRA